MHHLRNSLGAGKKTTFKCQNNFYKANDSSVDQKLILIRYFSAALFSAIYAESLKRWVKVSHRLIRAESSESSLDETWGHLKVRSPAISLVTALVSGLWLVARLKVDHFDKISPTDRWSYSLLSITTLSTATMTVRRLSWERINLVYGCHCWSDQADYPSNFEN